MDLLWPYLRYPVQGAELALVASDLLELPVQAVLCYSSTALTLHSAVGARIVRRGGAGIRAEAAKRRPAQVGDALLLSAGRLPIHHVLVAVTNERQAAPTLDTARAGLRAALELAAALGLESLALPLLRVRRRLDDDDLLAVTLAALIDGLSLPTAPRRVLLVADDEPERARAVMQRAEPLLAPLAQVGALRAQARALAAGETSAAPLREPEAQALARRLRRRRHQTLDQLRHLLERLALRAQLPGAGGLQTELRHCLAEHARLDGTAGHSAERELGGVGM